MILEDIHHDDPVRHTAEIIPYSQFLAAMARRDVERTRMIREEDPYAWAYRFGAQDENDPVY
jgi:hypothetical protein